MDLLLCVPITASKYPHGVLPNAIKFPLRLCRIFEGKLRRNFWDLDKSKCRRCLLIDNLYLKFFYKTTIYLPNLPNSLTLNYVRAEGFSMLSGFSPLRDSQTFFFLALAFSNFFIRGNTTLR